MRLPNRLIWFAVSLAILLVSVAMLNVYTTPPRSASQYSTAIGDQGQEVTLPTHWLSAGGSAMARHFLINFPLAVLPREPLFLYVPAFEKQLDLHLNGTIVRTQSAGAVLRGPTIQAVALIELPRDLLRVGQNEVDLAISTDPMRYASLSPVFLGTTQSLLPAFRLQHFVRDRLGVALFGADAFLGLCFWSLFFARRQETGFAWLGLSITATLLYSGNVFAEDFPPLDLVANWMLVLMAPAALGLLGFFAAAANLRATRFLIAVAISVPVLAFVLALTAVVSLRQVILFGTLPVAVVSMFAASAVAAHLLWVKPSLDRAIFVPGLAILIAGSAHDQLAHIGVVNGYIMLANPSRSLIVIGFSVHLMTRLAKIMRDLDQAAETLAARLRQREDELAAVFAQQRSAAEIEASASERKRILADLHDGVAGHLSTIVALTDKSNSSSTDIRSVARHALSELRMLIDTLDLPESDLRPALAALCQRSVEPLNRLGIVAQWSFAQLPEVPWLTREETLSVLRIVQEAVSNAVRHGEPKEVSVSGAAADNGDVLLKIVNKGGKPLGADFARSGHGLRNMRARAHALGGSTNLSETETGAEFSLRLPVQPRKKAPSAG